MTIVNEGWIKQAQDALDTAADKIEKTAGITEVPSYFSTDSGKSTALNSLIGGGLGALAGGVLGGFSANEAEGESALGKALISALAGGGLGALAAGGATEGANLLTGKHKLRGELFERKATGGFARDKAGNLIEKGELGTGTFLGDMFKDHVAPGLPSPVDAGGAAAGYYLSHLFDKNVSGGSVDPLRLVMTGGTLREKLDNLASLVVGRNSGIPKVKGLDIKDLAQAPGVADTLDSAFGKNNRMSALFHDFTRKNNLDTSADLAGKALGLFRDQAKGSGWRRAIGAGLGLTGAKLISDTIKGRTQD